MRWRFSNLIILRDKRELIIRIDNVHYFTRGSKVSLRNIGPETVKISRNIHPNNVQVSRVVGELIVTAATQIYQRTLSHRDWPASPVSRRAMPCSPMYTLRLLLIQYNTVRALLHTQHSTPRRVRYSDNLPMKIPCNCWNHSLWNHLSARPGKQMSLEFPGIILLQVQVKTKEFESWIHYWTIPLKNHVVGMVNSGGCLLSIRVPILVPVTRSMAEIRRGGGAVFPASKIQ